MRQNAFEVGAPPMILLGELTGLPLTPWLDLGRGIEKGKWKGLGR